MRVLFINNDGGGYAEPVDVADGTSVSKLFSEKLADRSPADYLIRVNRLPTSSDQVLADGDRVSMTPVKIDGARSQP